MLKILSIAVLLLLCTSAFGAQNSDNSNQEKTQFVEGSVQWSPWQNLYSYLPNHLLLRYGTFEATEARLTPYFTKNLAFFERIAQQYERIFPGKNNYLKATCRVGKIKATGEQAFQFNLWNEITHSPDEKQYYLVGKNKRIVVAQPQFENWPQYLKDHYIRISKCWVGYTRFEIPLNLQAIAAKPIENDEYVAKMSDEEFFQVVNVREAIEACLAEFAAFYRITITVKQLMCPTIEAGTMTGVAAVYPWMAKHYDKSLEDKNQDIGN